MKLRLIKNAPLFASFSEKERRSVAERMHLEHYKRDEALFAKGDPGQALYLIESGWVKLVADGKAVIANLGPGSLLGEADLFLGQPRSVDGVAASDVRLWTLTEGSLSQLISEHPEIGLKLSLAFGARIIQLRDHLIERRLKPLPFLADLSQEELIAVADKLSPREYGQSSFIFQSGQAPEAMFIIEAGKVRLAPAMLDEGEDFVELGKGDAFGEMALLTAKPYNAVAQAATDTIVWILNLDDFEHLIVQYPSIKLTLSRMLRAHLGSEDQALAVEHLRKVPLFAELPVEILQSIAKRLLLRYVPQGELVFAERSPGDAMYLIESGEVKVVSDAAQQREVFAYLQAGDFFGEMALLTGKTRSVAVRALTDVNLWMLYRSDFDELVVRYPPLSLALSKTLSERLAEADRRFVSQHLGEIKLLSGLSKAQLSDVADRLRAVKYKAGELICAEDMPGEGTYFIESGEVRVASLTGQRMTTLCMLGKGDFFDEASLPPSAMVQAITDVELWALSKADLDDLLAKYPHLAITINRVLSERLNRAYERLVVAKPPAKKASVITPARPSSPIVPRRSRPPIVRETDARAVTKVRVPTLRGVSTRTTQVRPRFARRAAKRKRTRISVPIVVRSSATRTTPVRKRAKPSSGFGLSQTVANAVQGIKKGAEDSANWFASRSPGAKLRLIGVMLLFIWLCGISAPMTVISAFSANNVSVRTMAFLQTVTPTFTLTPTPTDTPTATPTPTNTPTATNTPVPTDTPTPLPTDTPVPPTKTPVPLPTNTPTPEQPTATPVPEVDFRLVKVRKLTACENKGGHNIYIYVLDKEGNGLPNIKLWVSWGPEGVETVTGHKPEIGPGFVDFPMFKGTYSVEVMDSRSEVATGISPDIPIDEPCEEVGMATGNSLYHYSYEVVFQRTW